MGVFGRGSSGGCHHGAGRPGVVWTPPMMGMRGRAAEKGRARVPNSLRGARHNAMGTSQKGLSPCPGVPCPALSSPQLICPDNALGQTLFRPVWAAGPCLWALLSRGKAVWKDAGDVYWFVELRFLPCPSWAHS